MRPEALTTTMTIRTRTTWAQVLQQLTRQPQEATHLRLVLVLPVPVRLGTAGAASTMGTAATAKVLAQAALPHPLVLLLWLQRLTAQSPAWCGSCRRHS